MGNLLRNFDRISFWLGFIAATLLWWLIGRLRPVFASLAYRMKEQAQTARLDRLQGDEVRLGNDMLRLAQGSHLAAPLFSLDEIAVPPRLLAPAELPLVYEPAPSEDITDWAIPYMPDEPELASYYGAPTLNLAEALQGGANLAIIGGPGAGKSVALAYLACQIIRKQPEAQAIASLAPVLLHAADLLTQAPDPEDPSQTLVDAVAPFAPSIRLKRLPRALHTLLQQGRLLVLLDGLDELAPPQSDIVVRFLKSLLEKCPQLRVVAAAHPGNLGELPSLGFQVIGLANWGQAWRALFINRWSEMWQRHIAPDVKNQAAAEPLMLVGWLLNNSAGLSPLELTLKVWGAFAGDLPGPGPNAALTAYLRRITANQPRKHLAGLGQLATQMILAQETAPTRKNAERWLGGSEAVTVDAASEAVEPETEIAQLERVRARGALPDLIDCGLVIPRKGERISIQHPIFTAYLAGQGLASARAAGQVLSQTEWCGRSSTLGYLSIFDAESPWILEQLQEDDSDPLHRNLLQISRWLKNAPEGLPWIPQALRQLALSLQKDLPLGWRARALSALALSGEAGIPTLLRQSLTASDPGQRQLAALGLGYLREGKSTSELGKLIGDPAPGVSRAALLSIVAIGERNGLENVAYILLHGDELQRKAAAQALANHPEEGHPTLKEGIELEDPAVRRSVVYGLGRLQTPWAIEILERIAAEDHQWIVQDAANQMLQLIRNPHPRLPRPLPPLTHTAWLIGFAAERGIGVAPGRPAYELLYKALREGSEDQRLAAVYFLGQSGEASALAPLYQLYSTSRGELREAAFSALWNLTSCGLELPLEGNSPSDYNW